MSFSSIDLNNLRALSALLETGSVTGAARRLHVTQAAASNALRRLRDLFGDPLLVREGGHLRRTPRAEALRAPVAEAMRAAERVFAMEPSFDPVSSTEPLVVATSDHVDLAIFPALDDILQTDAPATPLVVRAFSERSYAELIGGGVDFTIAPEEGVPSGVVSEPLFEDTFVCVLRRDHPAAATRLSAKTLARLPHVRVAPRGDLAPGAVDAALAAEGLVRRVARTVPQFSVAVFSVARSDSVAVLPRSVAERWAPAVGLHIARPPVPLPALRFSAAWALRVAAEPRHRWFLSALRRAVGRAVADRAVAAPTARALARA